MDGDRRYILAPKGVVSGDEIRSGADSPIKPGSAMQLRHIPVGSTLHNVELKPGKGGQLARSAGSSAQYTAREGIYAYIRLKSGETRKVHIDCRATIGEMSNDEHNLRSYGKAGAKRWLGVRPTVRGLAMNPVDHPHGGGEGKSGQGNPHPVSPWGWNTKGKKTRTNKRTNHMIVQRRQNKVR
jgi:large subunit ribosomal protein L2